MVYDPDVEQFRKRDTQALTCHPTSNCAPHIDHRQYASNLQDLKHKASSRERQWTPKVHIESMVCSHCVLQGHDTSQLLNPHIPLSCPTCPPAMIFITQRISSLPQHLCANILGGKTSRGSIDEHLEMQLPLRTSTDKIRHQ